MALQDQDPNSLSSAWEPMKVMVATFLLGGLAGMAALLRDFDQKLSKRVICSACLNSSLISMAAAGLYSWYEPDTNFIGLMVVSVVIGIGGNTSIGIVTAIFLKKFNIVIQDPDKKDEKDDKESKD